MPDFSSRRKTALLALGVTLVLALIQGVRGYADLSATLGDTDDATRLVMVRDLLSTGHWFDLHIARYQPPLGVDMHWSRLVDGGLAGLDLLFRLFVSPAMAETLMRLVWPLLWLFPMVLGAMLIARRLGGNGALLVGAIFIACPAAIIQFGAGRIDHHNVQIALALLAIAGAVWADRRVWGGTLAGIASGLLLAVGLEALLFAVAVGAVFAVRFVLDDTFAWAARRYGISLATTLFLAFVAQTPPWHWTLSVCDALALNLLLGAEAAGLGLAYATTRPATSLGRRAGTMAIVALAAAGIYLALNPACLRGPFGGIDPRLYDIWLDHVSEIQPWFSTLKGEPLTAFLLMIAPAMGLAAFVLAMRHGELRRDAAWWVAGLMLLLATLSLLAVVRNANYAACLGAAVLGGAFARLAPEDIRSRMVPAAIGAFVVSPSVVMLAVVVLKVTLWPAEPEKADKAAACAATAAFPNLSALPAGLVLAPIDLGPRIIANTPHSVLAAPYHRMAFGILAAHDAFALSPNRAEPRLRELGVDYVVLCPGSPEAEKAPEKSLLAQLEAGITPPWLTPVPAVPPLKIFQLGAPSRLLDVTFSR